MFYAEQRRERYVSVFDVAAYAALRVARYFAEAARKAKRQRAAQAKVLPARDARAAATVLHAQAPPRESVQRMREDVDALRMQRFL
jgi:hypothetical protein